ncbi:hypothetical protein OIU74_014899 [Salix koriyanagi]|uniref:Uncharacterized protein n=1 Tax=Salix koriyanagi TaxID=2511006 RepID=A0A9Q0PXF0_9ROSI|nr:hypothetical protein OIU74_014899 [Salix koriyanagi]
MIFHESKKGSGSMPDLPVHKDISVAWNNGITFLPKLKRQSKQFSTYYQHDYRTKFLAITIHLNKRVKEGHQFSKV